MKTVITPIKLNAICLFILLAVSPFFVLKTQAQCIVPVGPSDTGQQLSYAATNYLNIAIDDNGTPYVVYQDYANSRKATVMKFNGSVWIPVGTPGFSDGAADYTSIAIDGNGTPYVVYVDNAHFDHATVMKFNGSAWVTVGAAGSAGSSIIALRYTDIAIDGTGTPYIVYQNGSGFGTGTVSKFNGSTWVTVGTKGALSGAVEYTDIAIDGSGTPYVVFEDIVHTTDDYPTATVMKFNGSAWVTVGTAGFSGKAAMCTRIAIASSGTPYVAYVDAAHSYKTTVMQFDNTAWVPVGNAGFSIGQTSSISIAIDNSGTPYVAYGDFGIPGFRSVVKKYNGSTWISVGPTTGFSYGAPTSMAIDGGGIPYVISGDIKATVMKFNNTWETVGGAPAGISREYARFTDLAIDASGIPYIAYSDESNSNKATVMKYNGNDWDTVGAAGFSAEHAGYISIAIDGSGAPYVAYTDAIHSSKVTVMKFNGTVWEQVGAAGVSATYMDIAIDGNGTPYVVYMNDNTLKVNVMKYNGSAWVSVGVPSSSSGGSEDWPSIVIDGSDTPYIVYQDNANASKATVMKFNGSAWISVGTSGISDAIADYMHMAIDNNGGLYVAYWDVALGKVVVMKFNGSAWISLSSFTSGEVGAIFSIAIDNNGTPYLAFGEGNNTGKATLVKYNGSTWETVGAAGFTTDQIYTIAIAIDQNGTPYIALSEGYAFVFKILNTPAIPNILGPTSLCTGAIQSYNITPVSGATSYIWTTSGGLSGTSSSPTITVNANSSGTLSVASVNDCGPSAYQELPITVGLCTNVDSPNSLTTDVAIYPNPTSDVLNVLSNTSEDLQVEIMNSFGKVLIPTTTITQGLSFDISNFAKGLYLLKISRDNQSTTVKIIKE